MRIAHLILSHKGPKQLARLVQSLAHPDADCYIHLDRKADFALFAFLQGQPNVYFTHTRLDVKWGGYSLTKVVLECSREILRHESTYDFINVLSAQDYPLKPAKYIHEFLQQHIGRSFIECEPQGSAWWQHNISRVEHYHLTEFSFPGRYAVQNIAKALLPRRKFPLPYTLYGGNMGGWYTLSRACAKYLLTFLDTHASVRRFAQFSWGSDEFLIHTILYNSPLKSTIHNDNLRHIDWSGGGASPKIFVAADFVALQNSPKLWARKFEESLDAVILNQLDHSREQQMAASLRASHAPSPLLSQVNT